MVYFKVIPSMAFAIAYLGKRLHKISKEANLSISALSAYLNEVHFTALSKRLTPEPFVNTFRHFSFLLYYEYIVQLYIIPRNSYMF